MNEILEKEMVITQALMLDEGKVDVLKTKYVDTDIMSEDIFNEFVRHDPTRDRSNKYLPWMLKQYSENKEGYRHIFDMIGEFAQLADKKKIEKTDIYQYKTLAELDTACQQASTKMTKSEKKTETKGDLVTILNNDEFEIIHPKNHKASHLLGMKWFGKELPWCTTYASSEHFNNYTYNYHLKFYYVHYKPEDSYYAVGVAPDGKKIVYNQANDEIGFDRFLEEANQR